MSWLRGEFDSALTQLEQATTHFAAAVRPDVDVYNVYNLPEMVAEAYTQLAATHLVRGDLANAHAALTEAEHVTEGLGFPEGPFNSHTCVLCRSGFTSKRVNWIAPQ